MQNRINIFHKSYADNNNIIKTGHLWNKRQLCDMHLN